MSVNSMQVLSAQKVLGQPPSSASELRLKLCDITWLIYSFFFFFFFFKFRNSLKLWVVGGNAIFKPG